MAEIARQEARPRRAPACRAPSGTFHGAVIVRIPWIRLIVPTALLAALAAVAHADPVAVVAALKGEVTVVHARNATPVRATFGRPLEAGERVVVGAGGSASLFFSDGSILELGEKSSMTLGARPAKGAAASGEPLPAGVFEQVARYSTGGSRESGLIAQSALRSLRTAAGAEPVSPRSTSVLDGRPELRWRRATGATRYVVTLSSDSGPLWDAEAADTALAYPADAPELSPGGEFTWEVRAFSGAGPVGVPSHATFRVAAAGESREVRGVLERLRTTARGGDTPAARYLAGSYLLGRGFLADAAEQFTALVRLDPRSPAPHEALGAVYRAMGAMDLAAAAYERALALGRER